ncbi:MFS transporter [Chloroflexi bacterium TSY]|nr:MFS transporter [Chloroflexi bacterium TSY]
MGADAFVIGGLFSITPLILLIVRPIVGWALDHYGRRLFFIIAIAGTSVAMLLFAFTETVGMLYAARIAQGIAAAFIGITAQTIVADLATADRRGTEMGRIDEVQVRGEMVGILMGIVIFSVLGDRELGWRLLFVAYAIICGYASWLAWRTVPETKPTNDLENDAASLKEHPEIQSGPVFASSSIIPSNSIIPHAFEQSQDKTVLSRYTEVFAGLTKPLLLLMLIVVMRASVLSMIDPIFLIYLQDRVTTELMLLGWAFFPAGIVYSFLPSRLGKLSDRFGRAPMMAIGMIVAGLFYALVPQLSSLVLLSVANVLVAVGWAFADPAEAALVADLTDAQTQRRTQGQIQSQTRGRAYAWYASAGSLGAIIGPLIGGWLYDQIGQAVPFYLNGIVLTICAIGTIILLGRSDLKTFSSLNSRLINSLENDKIDSVDPNLAFLAIFSRDCRDFGVIYSDFGYRKQPISYLKIAQI